MTRGTLPSHRADVVVGAISQKTPDQAEFETIEVPRTEALVPHLGRGFFFFFYINIFLQLPTGNYILKN